MDLNCLSQQTFSKYAQVRPVLAGMREPWWKKILRPGGDTVTFMTWKLCASLEFGAYDRNYVKWPESQNDWDDGFIYEFVTKRLEYLDEFYLDYMEHPYTYY